MRYKDIKKITKEHQENVLIDDDFEIAYGVPFEAFKNVSKADLIKALFIEDVIAEEGRSAHRMLRRRIKELENRWR